MKEFQAEGLWYLPEAAEKQIVGRIRFAPDTGLHLDLIGSLSETFGWTGIDNYDVICGILDQSPYGRHVLLLDCLRTKASYAIPGFQREELFAHLGLVASDVLDPTVLSFPAAAARYSHLTSWANVSGLKWEFPNDRLETVSVHYDSPAVEHARFRGSGLRLRWMLEADLVPHVAQLSEQALIEFEFEERLSIRDLMRTFVSPIQNLLTLAADAPSAVDDLQVFSPWHDSQHSEALPITVLMQPVSKPSPKERERSEFLFRLSDLPSPLTDFIEAWGVFSEQFAAFGHAFFGMQYAPPKYLEMRFSWILRCFRLFGLCSRSAERGVVEVMDEASRASLIELGTELDAILENHSELLGPLTSGHEVFTSNVLEMHRRIDYGLGPAEKRDRIRLHTYTEILTLLLKAQILRRVGFAEDRIVALFRKNPKYIFLQTQST